MKHSPLMAAILLPALFASPNAAENLPFSALEAPQAAATVRLDHDLPRPG